jgi:hypothetical protein
VIEAPFAAAWKAPPPKSVSGVAIAPPSLSTGETSSQARPSGSLKTLLGTSVVRARSRPKTTVPLVALTR